MDAVSENCSCTCGILFIDNLVDNHIQMHGAISISLHEDTVFFKTVLWICMWSLTHPHQAHEDSCGLLYVVTTKKSFNSDLFRLILQCLITFLKLFFQTSPHSIFISYTSFLLTTFRLESLSNSCNNAWTYIC